MTMAIPGNGYLLDPSQAPAFETSPLVLYGQIAPRAPDYLFRGDSLTSLMPAAPPLVLVANGGALVAQAFPGPGVEGEPNESPLMVSGYRYANASAVYHQVADPAVLDIDGSKSAAFSVCFRSVADAFPLNDGAIFGKRQAAGDLVGYELTLNTAGTLTFTYKDTALSQTPLGFSAYNNAAGQHRYADGRWHVVHVQFDRVGQQVRVGTEHAATMTAAWPASSLSTATSFRLGAVRAFAAGPIQIAWLAATLGQEAVAGDASTIALLLANECYLVQQLIHRNEPTT